MAAFLTLALQSRVGVAALTLAATVLFYEGLPVIGGGRVDWAVAAARSQFVAETNAAAAVARVAQIEAGKAATAQFNAVLAAATELTKMKDAENEKRIAEFEARERICSNVLGLDDLDFLRD